MKNNAEPRKSSRRRKGWEERKQAQLVAFIDLCRATVYEKRSSNERNKKRKHGRLRHDCERWLLSRHSLLYVWWLFIDWQCDRERNSSEERCSQLPKRIELSRLKWRLRCTTLIFLGSVSVKEYDVFIRTNPLVLLSLRLTRGAQHSPSARSSQ